MARELGMEESKQPYMQCEICGFWDSRLDAEVWRVEDLAKFARLDGPERCRGVVGLCAGTGHVFFYRAGYPRKTLQVSPRAIGWYTKRQCNAL